MFTVWGGCLGTLNFGLKLSMKHFKFILRGSSGLVAWRMTDDGQRLR